MKAIRYILGRIILLVDWLTRPKSMVRTSAEQQLVDEKLKAYSLYELTACPFCVKVRRECTRLGLDIKRENVKVDAQALKRLESEGGKYQVPCLHIVAADGSVEWVYESTDVITRLRQDFLEPTWPQDAVQDGAK